MRYDEDLSLTRHAAVRMQQRSVPQVGLWLVREFGVRESAGNGCWSYSFDKRGWKDVERFFGNWPLKSMERLRNIYIVMTEDEEVITVAYRA